MNRKILVLISMLSTIGIEAIDVLVQSRIKGAMMGAALGDSFARVANNRRHGGKILAKPIASFEDFKKDDWVYDTDQCRIGIGTEHTIIILNQFEALIDSRRTACCSLDQLIQTCAQSLITILDQKTLDPYYTSRHYHPKTIEKIKQLSTSRKQPALEEADAHALVRVIPVGIVFSDTLEMVKQIADRQILLTGNNPLDRVAGVALAVGIAHAVNNAPIDYLVAQMIEAARTWEEKLHLTSHSIRMSEYIRYASQAAMQGIDAHELLGSKIGKKVTIGTWAGYTTTEAVAAAVYSFIRNKGALKGALADSVHAEGNNTLIATLAGALAGAKTGFWDLTKQNYTDEFEMLEKINVLLGACNDAYVSLSDYPPCNGWENLKQGIGRLPDKQVIASDYPQKKGITAYLSKFSPKQPIAGA